ncbi:hypothetical protein GF336_07610 [Candidatus Woesearchaeota archaeon]|nr:hypothetical protein [Candidatus Woesearchaeota archaeon]
MTLKEEIVLNVEEIKRILTENKEFLRKISSTMESLERPEINKLIKIKKSLDKELKFLIAKLQLYLRLYKKIMRIQGVMVEEKNIPSHMIDISYYIKNKLIQDLDETSSIEPLNKYILVLEKRALELENINQSQLKKTA